MNACGPENMGPVMNLGGAVGSLAFRFSLKRFRLPWDIRWGMG